MSKRISCFCCRYASVVLREFRVASMRQALIIMSVMSDCKRIEDPKVEAQPMMRGLPFPLAKKWAVKPMLSGYFASSVVYESNLLKNECRAGNGDQKR